MKQWIIFALAFVLVQCGPSYTYRAHQNDFAQEVAQLVEQDKTLSQRDYLLFVGSSSIRLWDDMESDMKPYATVKRGYGGAHFYDLIHHTQTLIAPHQNARAILCFVANDIEHPWGDPKPKMTPQKVLRLAQNFSDQVKKLHPNTPLYFIEITPSPSRWALWPEISQANDLIQSWTEKTPNRYFISTRKAILGPDGQPQTHLFIQDGLHLSRAGYQVWTEQIKGGLRQTKD